MVREREEKIKKRKKKKEQRGSSLSLSFTLSLLLLLSFHRKRNTHSIGKSRARTTFRAKNLRGMSPPRAERILTREKETRRASRHGEKQRATRDFSLSLSRPISHQPSSAGKKKPRNDCSQRREIIEKTYYEPSPKITQSQV